MDIEGKLNNINVSGLLSRCIQHEIDHCNGVLFIDHLSQLKREIIQKKIEKKTYNNMSSNIIFMGTPDFAIPALKEIQKYFKLCNFSASQKRQKEDIIS